MEKLHLPISQSIAPFQNSLHLKVLTTFVRFYLYLAYHTSCSCKSTFNALVQAGTLFSSLTRSGKDTTTQMLSQRSSTMATEFTGLHSVL